MIAIPALHPQGLSLFFSHSQPGGDDGGRPGGDGGDLGMTNGLLCVVVVVVLVVVTVVIVFSSSGAISPGAPSSAVPTMISASRQPPSMEPSLYLSAPHVGS